MEINEVIQLIIKDNLAGSKLTGSLKLENLIKESLSLEEDFKKKEQLINELGFQNVLATNLLEILADIETKLNKAEKYALHEGAKDTSDKKKYGIYLTKLRKFRGFIEAKKGSPAAPPPPP